MSGFTNIKTRITSLGRGAIFFPDDFANALSGDTIRSALMRLCESSDIIRLAQGVYYYPVIDDKWGLGIIYPSIDDIAHAIAGKEKCRIIPTGATALNYLGLSTQMPVNVVYYTDGSPRSIKIGNGKGLIFKRTTDMKRFAYRNKTMQLIVSALREIGKGKLTASEKKIVSKHLQSVNEADFNHDITLSPAWVRAQLQELYEVY